MDKVVDYYVTPASPYAYLGHDRFAALAARHGAVVNIYPVDIGKVFAVSGGVAPGPRAPQRPALPLGQLRGWGRLPGGV